MKYVTFCFLKRRLVYKINTKLLVEDFFIYYVTFKYLGLPSLTDMDLLVTSGCPAPGSYDLAWFVVFGKILN